GAPLTTVEAMADWVMALAQAAGVARPAMVVGHSMGSLIALECDQALTISMAAGVSFSAASSRASDTFIGQAVATSAMRPTR
ncbi:alpha/beta hydrolase, partial [Ralstonia solanacearum species complex bacterium KE101]|uniref:alpha/beta fold hydrolase n=1 Tax=Ralstonia solanacearum species complex bacterium KE101 TaxID=3119587 RepID=UPI002FC542AA